MSEGNGLPTKDALILTVVASPADLQSISVVCSLRSTCGWLEVDKLHRTFDLRVDTNNYYFPAIFRLQFQLRELSQSKDSVLVEECILHVRPVTKIPKPQITLTFKPPELNYFEPETNLVEADSPCSPVEDLFNP